MIQAAQHRPIADDRKSAHRKLLPRPSACDSELRERVAACVRHFTVLAHSSTTALSTRFEACLDELRDAVLDFERSGRERESLLDILEPARRLVRRSPLVRRLQDWPRGYPGDFETIDYLMKDQVQTTDPFGGFCERLALRSAAAQQHRNKVRRQGQEVLRTVLKRRRPRILSLACGGCADLVQVLDRVEGREFELVLNDLDPEALEASRTRLGPVADRAQFIPGHVLKVVKRLRSDKPFDLVLAGGLCDYLPSQALRLLIRTVTEHLLAEGGKFFFTNIGRGNPCRMWMEYLMNWQLIERDEHDILRECRAAGVQTGEIKCSREETGLTILVEITRRRVTGQSGRDDSGAVFEFHESRNDQELAVLLGLHDQESVRSLIPGNVSDRPDRYRSRERSRRYRHFGLFHRGSPQPVGYVRVAEAYLSDRWSYESTFSLPLLERDWEQAAVRAMLWRVLREHGMAFEVDRIDVLESAGGQRLERYMIEGIAAIYNMGLGAPCFVVCEARSASTYRELGFRPLVAAQPARQAAGRESMRPSGPHHTTATRVRLAAMIDAYRSSGVIAFQRGSDRYRLDSSDFKAPSSILWLALRNAA